MAPRFRFTLQPLLEQRERIEDQRQQIMAQRQIALDAARTEFNRLDDDFRASALSLRERHGALDGEALRVHYAHLQFLDRAIVAQIRAIAERQAALDRARDDLLAASKERKVVDKLKARRRQTFADEELRIEQRELDDGNARQYGRQNSTAGGVS